MAMLLNSEEIQEKLIKSNGWEASSSQEIRKKYEFKDFAQALEFVNRVGALAEGMDHHPDIFLHDYKKVTLTLTTHSAAVPGGGDAGGLTRLDFDLAAKIENALLDFPKVIP